MHRDGGSWSRPSRPLVLWKGKKNESIERGRHGDEQEFCLHQPYIYRERRSEVALLTIGAMMITWTWERVATGIRTSHCKRRGATVTATRLTSTNLCSSARQRLGRTRLEHANLLLQRRHQRVCSRQLTLELCDASLEQIYTSVANR